MYFADTILMVILKYLQTKLRLGIDEIYFIKSNNLLLDNNY